MIAWCAGPQWNFVQWCWDSTVAKILIVDDSAFARNSLKAIVENAGHEVIGRAADGQQALTLFISLQPDLVTLDYLMTGENGDEVLDRILRLDPTAKVIMISGMGDNTIQERVLQAGAKVFLAKPYAHLDLLQKIDQVMEA
jgi:two-component system, chemotaxis family, chemotaxis protein CheY